MILNHGYSVDDKEIFLLLRGYLREPPCAPLEEADIPYAKLEFDHDDLILEYIFVPERMRGFNLSIDLLTLLFEYMETMEITSVKFECLNKPYWRKIATKFPSKIYFPPAGSERTNIVYIRHSKIPQ